ncbi:hypothetical protein GCM10010176_030460 [Nonomuraea spiralis]|nr:hypothetical protein GCM10010176_030460 [Nonomuraea spiralis]
MTRQVSHVPFVCHVAIATPYAGPENDGATPGASCRGWRSRARYWCQDWYMLELPRRTNSRA